MAKDKKNVSKTAKAVQESFDAVNATAGEDDVITMQTPWGTGQNWDNKQSQFHTLINDNLFPKIAETTIDQQLTGNPFDFLAKEVPNMTAINSEEYVIKDSIPSELNLHTPAITMLEHNYPKLITRLFTGAQFLKQKFTLNDNDATLNFQTIGDAVKYAMAVYDAKISNINVFEQDMIKGMLVDYSTKKLDNSDQSLAYHMQATSRSDLIEKIYLAMLNMQNNSSKYNEANLASGGSVGRYTTNTPISNMFILTDNETKVQILDSNIANTFQIAGLDITDRVISFDDLGGNYKLDKDVTISAQSTLDYLNQFGLYDVHIGDVFYAGQVFTFDISPMPEFANAYHEIKPQGDLYASVWDINSVRYKRKTAGMLKKPQYLGETDEWNYWIHYASRKYVTPFYNKIVIEGNTSQAIPVS